ncbi:MAG: hypothetical protein ABWY04_01855 [Arthrobacter sp.]
MDRPAPRRSTIRWGLWIPAGVGVLLLAGAASWFVGANLNESAKIDKMVAVANGIPDADWEVTRSSDPKHDIGCIPFDQSCHTLFRGWKTPAPLDVNALVTSTGYELKPDYLPGCATGWVDRVHLQLCVDGNDVDVAMFDR